MPTKLIKGEKAVLNNRKDLILGKRIFIVTGRTSGAKSGALDDVTSVLNDEGVEYMIYDKISNNPSVEECYEGGRVAREFGADALVGIGGGSPLDATKAIAVYSQNPTLSPMDIFLCDYPSKPLPMAAIPTTAGTGSEVTQYSVLTVNSERNKRSFSTKDTFYKVAFLDAGYTKNLPLQITRNTAVDALSHLIEGYTNTKASEITDYIAVEGMRLIGNNLPRLSSGELDEKAREELLWASTLGGMLIAQTGTTIVHSMGYPLTYFKDIPHGMANGMLLGEYLERASKPRREKVDIILGALKLNSVKDFKEALMALLPSSVSFEKNELEEWARFTCKAKNASTSPFEINEEVERDIFIKALI